MAAVVVCLLWLVWPHFYWWIYAIIWFFGGAVLANQLMEFEANRKMADRD